MLDWVGAVIQGMLLGGLYAMFALGLSLMFGVMRLTNVAHGDLVILAAFGAFTIAQATGVSPFLAGLLLLPVAFGAGYALQRGVLNATLGKDPLPSLVATFGVSIVLQNLLMELYTADPRALDAGGLQTASIAVVEGLSVGTLPLLTFAAALALTVAMQWLFGSTPLGRAFRATSDDREVAQLMGLDARRVYALATAIAFVLIAVAGTLYGLRTTFSPTDGPALLLYAFEAVIIGGMGSFWGSFAGGVILGVTQSVGFRLDPGWGIWLGHVVFLLVLVLRPQGLFPRTR
jgi:branched-chain amino acid transport system permease protein